MQVKYRFLTYLGVLCSVLAMVLGFVHISYINIARDLIALPQLDQRQLSWLGLWLDGLCAIGDILLCFIALMCTCGSVSYRL